MRVLVTADPYLPVPPTHYGGIERVIDLLVRGLAARGHEVTLLAHPDSKVPASLLPYGKAPHVGMGPRTTELAQVGSTLWRLRRTVDVVHSFGRLAALLPILPLRRVPKIQSYQRAVPWPSIAGATTLAGRSIAFTGCSASVSRERVPGTGAWHTIFNGVDLDEYEFRASVADDAPLMFLGRLEPIKGAHHAIAIARAAGRVLTIAGNRIATAQGTRYFDEQIAPHVDGRRVRYVGEVDDRQKNALLGAAAALLMPIEWEEPFGIEERPVVLLQRERRHRDTSPLPLAATDRGVPEDREQPGPQGTATLEAIEPANDAEPGLLHDLLGYVAGSDVCHGNAQQGGAVGVDQRGEGLLVAAAQRHEQLFLLRHDRRHSIALMVASAIPKSGRREPKS